MAETARARLARELDPRLRREPGLSPLNWAVFGLILLSILIGVLGTEPLIRGGREGLFAAFEAVLVTIFAAEYLARLWIVPENPAWRSRLAWALSPAALVDLVVVVALALPIVGSESALVRLLRVARLLRLAQLGRFSTALQLLSGAVAARRMELAISLMAAFALMLLSSTLLYMVEGPHQPEAFGSIPRAMWWAVATLTTVGYGDVVPITGMGRVFAAVTALTGIALIAVPTGILSGAFAEAFEEARRARRERAARTTDE